MTPKQCRGGIRAALPIFPALKKWVAAARSESPETRSVTISREDLERDKALLFDARNLVEAIGLVIENIENPDDMLVFVIQSLARVAVEKIATVTAGNVIDPLLTDEDLADMEEAAARDAQEGSPGSGGAEQQKDLVSCVNQIRGLRLSRVLQASSLARGSPRMPNIVLGLQGSTLA